MEKIVKEECNIIKIKHQFFCDACGKYLGETEEYNDGYFDCIGYYKQSVRIQSPIDRYSERLTVTKCLCPECAISETTKFTNALYDLGFVEEV